MLDSKPVSVEWIAGMCRTIRATWWTPDMSDEERQAWIAAYVDALAELPAPFVIEAQRRVFSRFTRRPTPADLANEARQIIRDAHFRLRLERRPEPREEPNIAPPSPETIAEINALLATIGQPVTARHPETPTWPVPMDDQDLADLLKANPRRDPKTPLDRIRAAEGISRPEDVREAKKAVERRAAERADHARKTRARAPDCSGQQGSRE